MKISVYVIAAILPIIVSGCSELGLAPLSADPINSQVVDARSGEPVEGVVVVAYWPLKQGSLGGGALPCGAANVEETVTDKDGRFHIPGWGPTLPGCGGVMHESDPAIFLFKPGYYYKRYNNDEYYAQIVTVTHSGWENQKMEIDKFPDMDTPGRDPTDYSQDFNTLNIDLGEFVTYMPTQCNWKKMPNMLRALEQQRLRISRAAGHPRGGITAFLINNDEYFRDAAPKCGSPKEFIEGLMK